MLQTIRDRTQGLIAGIIISLLILSFALWGIHSYLVTGATNNIAATVNGVQISQAEFSATYNRLKRQLQIQFNHLDPNAEAHLKEQTLQALINLEVLKQGALNSNFRITSDQVDDLLRRMPEFKVNGEFSLARFQQVLNATSYTPSEFISLVKTRLLIDQPRLGMIFTSFALPDEIKHEAALVEQQRHFEYIEIPKNHFAADSLTISNEKIEAYYKKYINEFKTDDQIVLQYVEVSLKELASTFNPDDQMMHHFYKQNTNLFISPAQWKLREIQFPLPANASNDMIQAAQKKMGEVVKLANEGKDFKELVNQDSQLKLVENHGWQTLAQVPKELQNQIEKTTHKNKVLIPTQTSSGIILYKVVDYKPGSPMSYNEAKDKVKAALTDQKSQEKLADLREKLANIAYEHPENLTEAAKQLALKIKTTGSFTKQKGTSDISSNPKVRAAAFSHDVLIEKNNSDVIQVDPETIVVVRVKSYSPATIQPLTSVRHAIIEKLRVEELDNKSLAYAQSLKSAIEKGATFTSVAEHNKLKLHQPGFVGRHAEKIDPAILESAFSMPKPVSANIEYTIATTPHKYVLIALKEVKNGNIDKGHTGYTAFGEQIQNNQGSLEYELYKNSLIKNSKIVLGNS